MSLPSQSRSAAREASEYFNSLPIEQRRKLAPLLEDYRRLGIEEAMRDILSVQRRLNDRARRIVAESDSLR